MQAISNMPLDRSDSKKAVKVLLSVSIGGRDVMGGWGLGLDCPEITTVFRQPAQLSFSGLV
ncbi:hypothetical protein [Ferribacterium limneticum]|uniref:hypothetical protein n=1 Tax=Ferribacterium limneticum TaxID=76259 RepID=UPI001CFB5FC9|nr:hypothetical protein [Ferribacterium limneticum]